MIEARRGTWQGAPSRAGTQCAQCGRLIHGRDVEEVHGLAHGAH